MEADFDDVGGDDLMIVMDSSGFVIVLADYYGKEARRIYDEVTKNKEETRLDLGCSSTAFLLIPP